LKEFPESVNQQLKGKQIPEDQVKEINNNLNEFAKEVQDMKPGEEELIDYVKQTQIESKTASTIQKVLNVLPEAAETAATFTPLAPFSKLIGKGVQGIVDAIVAKRRREMNPFFRSNNKKSQGCEKE
jgi:SMC interacting uncharacterized protein involved in chromosome segregation